MTTSAPAAATFKGTTFVVVRATDNRLCERRSLDGENYGPWTFHEEEERYQFAPVLYADEKRMWLAARAVDGGIRVKAFDTIAGTWRSAIDLGGDGVEEPAVVASIGRGSKRGAGPDLPTREVFGLTVQGLSVAVDLPPDNLRPKPFRAIRDASASSAAAALPAGSGNVVVAVRDQLGYPRLSIRSAGVAGAWLHPSFPISIVGAPRLSAVPGGYVLWAHTGNGVLRAWRVVGSQLHVIEFRDALVAQCAPAVDVRAGVPRLFVFDAQGAVLFRTFTEKVGYEPFSVAQTISRPPLTIPEPPPP